MKKAAIIMAAGLGTRMNSSRSKVLHDVCGLPMLQWVLDALEPLGLDKTVVVLGSEPGSEFGLIRGKVDWVVQEEKRGTGHAVMQAEKVLERFDGSVLILSGDVPLITSGTLKALLDTHERSGASAVILTAVVHDPKGYGRIIRQGNRVGRIIEELDADEEVRTIKEINTGTYCFRYRDLREALKQVKPNPLKKEYYLTDVFGILNAQDAKVVPLPADDSRETTGVNTRVELAFVHRVMQERIQKRLMTGGVTILDGVGTYIGADVRIGRDTVIYPSCFIDGKTDIGEDCRIGPGARVIDSVLGDGVVVRDSWVESGRLGDGVAIGPFEHIRAGNFPGPKLSKKKRLKKAVKKNVPRKRRLR